MCESSVYCCYVYHHFLTKLSRFGSYHSFSTVVISGGLVDWVKFQHMLLFMLVLLLMDGIMESMVTTKLIEFLQLEIDL